MEDTSLSTHPATKVLICIERYLPGFKAGGPVRTIANLVEQLGEAFQFWIVTNDRDVGDTRPYENIQPNAWNDVGDAKVFYASPGTLSLRTFRSLVRETQPDVIYLNSFFSLLTTKVLCCRRLRLIPDTPIVVAPRGEFAQSALRLKATKKWLFKSAASAIGLHTGVTWQASTTTEEADIRSAWAKSVNVRIAQNIAQTSQHGDNQAVRSITKCPGSVRFVFLGRVAPIKNLKFAIDLLRGLNGNVEFHIYGPLEDQSYWRACEAMITTLPENIDVRACGAIPAENVPTTLANYHFLLLPTKSENFGHAVLEALAVGCPAVVSDQTPWRRLTDQEAGWDIPLSDVRQWREVVQRCVDMSDADYQRLASQARLVAMERSGLAEAVEQNVALLSGATRV